MTDGHPCIDCEGLREWQERVDNQADFLEVLRREMSGEVCGWWNVWPDGSAMCLSHWPYPCWWAPDGWHP